VHPQEKIAGIPADHGSLRRVFLLGVPMSEIINTAAIGVVIDATGVEVGMRKIEEAAAKTGRTLDNLGRGDGFKQIGASADAASGKVDRTTKGFQESITRATLAMSAGAKGSAEYYAALANSRGANVAALKPYLDQLAAVTRETKLAADAQKKLADGDSFLKNLRGQSDAIGKTASQLAELRAAELGVSDAAAPMIQRLREAEEAAGGLGGVVETTSSKIRGFVIGLAGAVSVGGFVAGIKSSIDALADLDDMSQKTGSTVENLSRLQKVAQMVGQDFGAVDVALVKLSKGMGGLDEDSNKVIAALGRLNVSAKDAAGNLRDPSEVLVEATGKLQEYADGAGKTALVNDLLGKSGADLLPYMNDVAENFDKFAGSSAAAAKEATLFQDRMGLLRVTSDELFTSVASYTLPALVDLAGAFGDAAKEQSNLVDGSATGWADDLAMGLARVADVAILIPRLLSGIAGSFKVVAADIKFMAAVAENANPVTAAKKFFTGGSANDDLKKALDERNKTLEDANKKYDDLWNKPANGIEQALIKRMAGRGGDLSDFGNGSVGGSATKPQLGQGTSPKDAKDRTDAIDKEAEAYASLVASINERIAASSREAAGLAPMTEAQKLQVALDEQLKSGKLKLTAAHKADYEQRIQTLGVNNEIIESQKRAALGAVAAGKIFEDYRKSVAQSLVDATKEADKNEELARTFGLTKTAIAELELARLEEQLAQRGSHALTIDEIDDLEKLIEAKKRSAAAVRNVEDKDVVRKANETILTEQKKAVEQYSDIFRTGFADMLNNGKDGWKSFTKSLVTTFKTTVADQIYKMFAQPFVVRMVASLLGVTGGTASTLAQAAGGDASGGSGYVGVAQSAKMAYDAISSGFANIGTAVADGVQVGMNAAGMSSNVLTNGPAAQMAGTAATYVAGITAGKMIGSAISGKYEIGGHGSAIVNIGTAAGAIFGGPIGAAIGGTIAGLMNRAFGMGPEEVKGRTLNGSLGAGGFTGGLDTKIHQDGGWFRSDRDSVRNTPADAATSNALASAYDQIKVASADFAGILGLTTDSIKDRTQSLSIALTSDNAANQKAITDFFVGVGDSIAKELLPTISDFSKAATEFGGVGESASATLQRIATNYAFIDVALASINTTFGSVGVGSVSAREKLIDLSGGLEAFGKGVAGFAQNYLTEAERLVPVGKTVAAAFASLGIAAPETREQFKALVMGLDLTTTQGATTYASLIKVQDGFAQLHPAIEATTDAIASQRQALQDQLDQLTMSPAQLLAKDRGKVDPSNQGLFDEIQGAAAFKEAAAAAKTAMDALAQVNSGYQDQIDSILKAGMSAGEIRKMEISGMDASTVALYDRLAGLKAEAAATVLANEAIEKAKEAAIATAKANADFFQSVGDALAGTMKGATDAAKALRGFNDSLLLGNLSPLDAEARYQAAKSQFASAEPGDTSAATAYLEAAKARDAGDFSYSRDFAAVQAKLGAAAIAQDERAASIPAFWRAMQERAVPETAPQFSADQAAMVASRAYTSTPTTTDTSKLEAEMKLMREQLAAALALIAASTAKAADIQEQLLAEAP
jgi:hypothetical protein